MLTNRQLDQLASRLRDEKARLDNELLVLEEGAHELADCSVSDRGDAAALLERRHRATALIAHHRETQQEIDAALLRMTNGRYGISESTGKPIPFERLQALPWARSDAS